MKRVAFVLSLLLVATSVLGLGTGFQAFGSRPPSSLAKPVVMQPVSRQPALVLDSIRMVGQTEGWAISGSQVLRTADGGTTWWDASPGWPRSSEKIEGADFRGSTRAWVTRREGDDLRVFRTVDGGRIWETSTVQVGSLSGVVLQFSDDRNGWMLVQKGVAGGSMPVTVWGTTDGGATWSLLAKSEGASPSGSGLLPYSGVKTGIASRDAQAGWVSAESRVLDAVPLWWTEDRGATWKRQDLPVPEPYRGHTLTTWAPWFLSYKEAVLPVTFVPGYDTVFYTTHNGGFDWQPGAPVKGLPQRVADVSGFLDVSRGWTTDGHTIYLTADGGRSWEPRVPNVDLTRVRQLQFDTMEIGWALTDTALLKTTDGGSTWAELPAARAKPVPESSTDSEQAALTFARAAVAHDVDVMRALLPPDRQGLADSKALDFRNGHGVAPPLAGGPYIDAQTARVSEHRAQYDVPVGLVYGNDVVRYTLRLRFRRDDGGRWWVDDVNTPMTEGRWQSAGEEVRFRTLHMMNGEVGWAEAEPQRILRTTDGGHTWYEVTPPLPAHPEDPSSVQARAVFLTSDITWAAVSERFSDQGGPAVTSFVTEDGGRSWRKTSLPLDRTPIFGASITALDARRAWVMVVPEHGMSTSPGDLFATTDGGRTWTLVASSFKQAPGTLPFSGAVRFSSPTTGWLAGNRASTASDLLFVTHDGGRTWNPVTVELGPLEGRPHRLSVMPTFGPEGNGVLAVSFYGSEPGQVNTYATRDGGRTWTEAGSRPSWSAPSFRDGRHGWVVMDGKFYRTGDAGATWENFTGPSRLLDLQQIQFTAEAQGWALAGGSLWRTQDGGRAWKEADAFLAR